MTRVSGVTTSAVPVEILAKGSDDAPVTGVLGLYVTITRESDGLAYDFHDGTFKASPVTLTGDLVEVDAVNLPGLYHLPGGFTVPGDDTYAFVIDGVLSPVNLVDNLPQSSTLVVGPLVGAATLGANLVDDLAPTIDALRADLHAQFGVRQFAVRQIRREWSGASVGVGAAAITEVMTLSPAPKVTIDDTHTLTPGGLQATGTVTFEEVSLSYSQDQLLGQPMAANEEFFYAIDDALGQGLERRLAIPQDHPVTDREGAIGWKLVTRLVDRGPLVVA